MGRFFRIGDKLIDPSRIRDRVKEILALRSQGFSQQEVADRLGVDRTFISRLESMGEVRRGGSLALIAMPVANKDEVMSVAAEEGVELSLVMNNRERWAYVQDRSGAQLVNDVVRLIGQVRTYDKTVVIGSDERVRFVQALLDKDVIPWEIGRSPLSEDVYVDPERLRNLIREIKA